MRFAFVHRHCTDWPVQIQCDVLGVTRSGFYAWLRRQPGPRAQRREHLVAWIRQIHADSRRVYGSPRVAVELREDR